jgi:hypothetical protein
MASDTRNDLLFAHKTNIEKYRRILETHLTAEERRFVERRPDEERTAVEQLAITFAIDALTDQRKGQGHQPPPSRSCPAQRPPNPWAASFNFSVMSANDPKWTATAMVKKRRPQLPTPPQPGRLVGSHEVNQDHSMTFRSRGTDELN